MYGRNRITKSDLRRNRKLSRTVKRRNSHLFQKNKRNRFIKSIHIEKSNETVEKPRNNWGIDALGIKDIWNETKGDEVKVAVLDTGITPNHIEFDSIDATNKKLYKGFVATLVAGANDVFDTFGHGTQCAGIIGAKNRNKRLIGIAPESKLMIGKVTFNDNGIQPKEVSNGINWAVDNGADIISMSFELDSKPNKLVRNAINRAVKENLLIVCSAGAYCNNWMNYPAVYKNTIAVGSVKLAPSDCPEIYSVKFDENQSFVRACPSPSGNRLTIMAPGDMILTTVKSINNSSDISKDYGTFSGTSAAAPFLAGVLALFVSKLKKTSGISFGAGELHPFVINKLKESTFSQSPTFNKGFGMGVINPQKLMGSI